MSLYISWATENSLAQKKASASLQCRAGTIIVVFVHIDIIGNGKIIPLTERARPRPPLKQERMHGYCSPVYMYTGFRFRQAYPALCKTSVRKVPYILLSVPKSTYFTFSYINPHQFLSNRGLLPTHPIKGDNVHLFKRILWFFKKARAGLYIVPHPNLPKGYISLYIGTCASYTFSNNGIIFLYFSWFSLFG